MYMEDSDFCNNVNQCYRFLKSLNKDDYDWIDLDASLYNDEGCTYIDCYTIFKDENGDIYGEKTDIGKFFLDEDVIMKIANSLNVNVEGVLS